MELGQEQAAACPRATSSVPSPCHLPELYLPLLPSPLLPFWLLSVFFYVLVLFLSPALPLLLLRGEICPSTARHTQDHHQGKGGFLS